MWRLPFATHLRVAELVVGLIEAEVANVLAEPNLSGRSAVQHSRACTHLAKGLHANVGQRHVGHVHLLFLEGERVLVQAREQVG